MKNFILLVLALIIAFEVISFLFHMIFLMKYIVIIGILVILFKWIASRKK